MYSNCVFWAVWQKITKGGILSVEKSPNYWFVPRVKWSLDGKKWWCFIPDNRTSSPSFLQNLLPIHTFLFKGTVKRVYGPKR